MPYKFVAGIVAATHDGATAYHSSMVRFSDPEWHEQCEERAVICEYAGGLDRRWAEVLAYATLPPDYSDDWLEYIDPAQ